MRLQTRLWAALSVVVLAGLAAFSMNDQQATVVVVGEQEVQMSERDFMTLQFASELGILAGFGLDPSTNRLTIELALEPAPGAFLPEQSMVCESVQLDELGRLVAAIPASASSAPPSCAVLFGPHPTDPRRQVMYCVGTCSNGQACPLYFDLGTLRWVCGCP